MIRALLVVALLAGAITVGCKQGVGDRCQINADCASGLICNQAKNTCQTSTGVGGIDATVPDGPPADARVDAMVDAKVFMDAPVGVR